MHKAQEELLRLVLAADRIAANALMEAWLAQNSSDRLIPDLLDPVLQTLGNLWNAEDNVNLAQGYVAAKIAEDAFAKVQEQTLQIEITHGPVVLCNIEDDFHALGRKMVGNFLRLGGWVVTDLGNDVPAAEIVNKAEDMGARVIGVSAMMEATARNIGEVREILEQRHLSGQVQLAVGGAVFKLQPELLGEVGGDGTAKHAAAVPDLFARLWVAAEHGEAST